MGRFYRSTQRSRIPIAIDRLEKLRKLKKLAEARARAEARLKSVSRIPVAIHRLKKPSKKSAKSVTRIPRPFPPIPGTQTRQIWPPKRKMQKAARRQHNEESKTSSTSTSNQSNQSATNCESDDTTSKSVGRTVETPTKKVGTQADSDRSREKKPFNPVQTTETSLREDQPKSSRTDEDISEPNNTPSAEGTGLSTQRKDSIGAGDSLIEDDLAKGDYLRLREDVIAEADRYLEQILTQSDKRRGDMATKWAQVRHQQDLCKKADLEAKMFRAKFEDEKICWSKSQEKKYMRKARSLEWDLIREEKARMNTMLARLREERDRLREALGYTADENTSLKQTTASGEESARERETGTPKFEMKQTKHLEAPEVTPNLPRILPEVSTVSRLQSRLQGHVSPFGILPSPPPCCTPRPPSGTRRSRRPYTGKSRKEQTLKLPPITENQRVTKNTQSIKDVRNDNSAISSYADTLSSRELM